MSKMADGGRSLYMYKIVPSTSTVPITSSGQLSKDYLLPVSELDKKDGYMHMSTAAQIPATLSRFFRTSTSAKDMIYLFKVPYLPLEEKRLVRWEDGDGKVHEPWSGDPGVFPHIYDDQNFIMSHGEVETVAEVVSEVGEESWQPALSRLTESKWLV